MVRLVNGGRGRPYQGRVEVYYRGRWGTICDDGFDINEGNVICRYLGYCHGALRVYGSARFGRGRGPIWFDDMRCTGRETSPFRCRKRTPIGSHNCGHHEDAGVVCRSKFKIYLNICMQTAAYGKKGILSVCSLTVVIFGLEEIAL